MTPHPDVTVTAIDANRTLRRFARILTEGLSPAVLVAGALIAVAWHAGTSPGQAVVMGLVASTAASFVPISYIVFGVRRGRWTDHHVTLRHQRKLPLLMCLLSTAVGTVALVAIGAPRELTALITSMTLALAVVWPVTVLAHFKISVHALVASGTAAAIVVVFGPAVWVVCPVALAVCWSRVVLRDHTLPQVVAGAAVGLLATAVAFPMLLS